MRIVANMNLHERDSACSLPIGQTRMVVLLIITTLHAGICKAQLTMCNHNVNYTKGSRVESNLNTVLNSLVQHTSQTGFNTSEHGQGSDQIYGLLQCRGDTTADRCYNCSQRARSTVQQSCGNAVGGRIWMDVCYLRYENYSFSGKLDSFGMYTYITSNVSNSDAFDAALERLFRKLSAEAAASGSELYASGIITDSLSRKIYGLVQCWRDISSNDCTTCLSDTINSMLATYPGNPGVQGLMANCIVRYEIYPFFNSTALPPSPSSPAGEPEITPVGNTTPKENAESSNNGTQINQSAQESSKKITTMLGVVGALLLV